MPIVFERLLTQGISQLSYLIGDDEAGTACVIDPLPNADIYMRLSRKNGVTVTHVFETHNHADFMSGARELVDRLGTATLCVSGEGGATYGFNAESIQGGDVFRFGSVILTARHTPGHTPEHLSYEIAEKETPENPWAVLTGDSLLVGSAGRPDLLDEEQKDKLSKQLFHTLRDYYLKLDDGVLLYPGHGAGSACGADIGDRPMSAIGFERKSNPFLQFESLEKFRTFVDEGAPPEPNYYQHLKKVNAQGPPILGHAPVAPGLPPKEFQTAIEKGDAQLLDTRRILAFGGGHISGAINIGPRPELSMWAGQILDYDKPILIVVDDEKELEWFLWRLVYTGFTNFAGYLTGGMKAWVNEGLPLERLQQITVHEVKERLTDQILDVRAPEEWEGGHIPGAKHFYVADMKEGLNGAAGLVKKKPVIVYCASGYRASIAASLLQREGFKNVLNVPGSWLAWTRMGYEIEP